ncbi:hypothetical protein LCGC14_3104710, partial [marine sediment metagenome]
TATFELDPGETVTCTFTNTKRGTITVIKDTDPDGPQNFDFTFKMGIFSVDFILDDDNDPERSNTVTFTNLLPDTYTVTEKTVAGFVLTNITCTGDTNSVITTSTANANAIIVLAQGEDIICTFTNVD